MVNQQVLAGHWNEVSGKLKEKWANLTDDELTAFEGTVDQLVGKIQRKTGESRSAIERFLGEVATDVQDATEHARHEVEHHASQAASAMQHGYESIRDGIQDAGRVIQDRPGQSLAVAFGLGLAVGAGVALLLRDRPAESTLTRGRAYTEQFGRQMLDALQNMMPRG